MFYLVNPWFGSTVYFLVGAQGTYVVSGQIAQLLIQRGLVASAGTYTVAGQAVTLYKSVTLVAAQGTYDLTGQTAALVKKLILAAAQGSYSVVGQAAALFRQLRIDAVVGTYAITGQDAQLRLLRMTADLGIYTTTGQTAALLYKHILAADQGSYAVAGQDAVLRKTINMLADFGLYSVLGQDAGLVIRRLTADQGAYAVTGQAASLLFSHMLVAAQGTYAISGQDAAFRRSLVVVAAQGTYGVTGQDALLARTLVVAAAVGTYSVSGQAATLTYTGGLSIVNRITSGASNANPAVVSLPASLVNGNWLVLAMGYAQNASQTTPSGWTLVGVANAGATGSNREVTVFKKQSDGTEGSTVSVTQTGTASGWGATVWQFSGAVGTVTMAGTGVDGASGGDIDTPSLDMGSSALTWWLSCGIKRQTPLMSAAPSGYSNLETILGGASNQSWASASKQSTAQTEDPGAFSGSTVSDSWAGATIGVR